VLVIIGVHERGKKHFLAIEDGVRESTRSWREVLLDWKGSPPALLGAQDGECAELPAQAVHPKVKKALQQIWIADDQRPAQS